MILLYVLVFSQASQYVENLIISAGWAIPATWGAIPGRLTVLLVPGFAQPAFVIMLRRGIEAPRALRGPPNE